MTDRIVLEKLEWNGITNEKSHPGWLVNSKPGGLPIIRCECGGFVGLWAGPGNHHEIAANGEVNPSFLHPTCGWHVYLTLKGWQS